MEKHSGILLIAAGLSLVSTDIEKAAALRNQKPPQREFALAYAKWACPEQRFFSFLPLGRFIRIYFIECLQYERTVRNANNGISMIQAPIMA